jgi:hypothetical protein
MKIRILFVNILITATLMNCGSKEEKMKPGFTYETQETTVNKEVIKEQVSPLASKKIDLINKGIGPIKSITLENKIDKKMGQQGADTFRKLCTACHKTDKKFIGPPVQGILERRTPEWIMNMMLNPVEMTQKDPIAKDLLIEFNGAPMPSQSLTEEDARAILEYFRTL